ncbi:hypothetical protein J7F03_40190 [Streptomyces sp. ISL-43]|uniref:hypothetical protein n=1 Tax=Streptomyces sp. ISL-43 TaxID=2819183 RepID=UPI001BEAF76C|nr:hypothetical protein [Streptomyces sp. ISL-43]MBT2453135.1 hypothetical protein [Streptomyces sp. ISL-43]
MRRTQRNWLWLLLVTAGTIGLLALLTFSTVDDWSSPSTPISGRAPDPDQVIFRKGVNEDRRSLFNGVLYYQPPKAVDVGDTLEFSALLTAIRSETPPEWPPGDVVAQRALRVGGVQKAYLSEAGKNVDIDVLGSSIGTIAAPGDEVEWRWYLTPRKPGTYTLKLTVETYRGDSDVLLARTAPPIDIILSARATWAYRITSARNWLIGLAATLAALTALGAVFRRPLTAIFSRILGSRRRSDRQQP